MSLDKIGIPKKTIVAADGSEDGYKAADYAIALAARLQSVILFLYVAGASSAEHNYSISVDMALSNYWEQRHCPSVLKGLGKKVSSLKLLVPGGPVDEILKNAESANCDSIVVGRRAQSEMGKLLMGSVSDKVSKLSDISVTVVT